MVREASKKEFCEDYNALLPKVRTKRQKAAVPARRIGYNGSVLQSQGQDAVIFHI